MLQAAIDEAKRQGKKGLVTVVDTKKYHFMSDTKWLLRQGKVIKLETMEQAQSCPSPATIFSLYLDGEFITTDISVCMDSRFDKIVGKR